MLGSLAASATLLEVGSWFYVTRIVGRTAPRGQMEKVLDQFREYKLTTTFALHGRVTNAQGFRRSEDVSQDKPEGTYRIFLMGGSAAYGAPASAHFPPYLIANEDTIAARLEEGLRDRVPGLSFEVINAAVGGYRTYHHLVYLNQALLDYDPDMVIFMDGHNDHYNLDPDTRPFEPVMDQVESLSAPTLGFVALTTVHALARKSWFFHGVWMMLQRGERREQARREFYRGQGRLEDYESIARRTFLSMIKRNVIILEDEGVIPLVFLQPELILQPPEKLCLQEKELVAIEVGLRADGYREQMEKIYGRLVPMLSDLASEYGFEFHDLNPLFHRVAEQCFVDHCHLTPKGGQVIADYMAERVLARLAAERIVTARDGSS